MPDCHGNGKDHCCYVAGKVCKFLQVDVLEDRYWTCGLRKELGSWDLVHQDPRYLEHVKPFWETFGVTDCGDWRENQCCFAGEPEVHNTGEE